MKQLYLKLIVLALACSYNCDGQTFKRDNSELIRYASFVKNPFYKLTSLILTSLEVFSLGECTFQCLNNQRCYSVNYGETSEAGGKHKCELLNADMFNQPDKLAVSGDFHHYNIKTPCMKHPCQNGGTCSPIYNEDDYNCACIPGYIGRHCDIGQIVICERETGQLSCGGEGKINVLSANYGRLDSHTCSLQSHDDYQTINCRAGNSLARVEERCQGNAHCELTANNNFFGGDPCKKTPKYLLVKYRCEN